MDEDESASKYDTDPILDIVNPMLPHEEKMHRLIGMYDQYGGMDFLDYVPHDLHADFYIALEGREEERKVLAKERR